MDQKKRETEGKARFATTMEEAWKNACQIYLKESGLDEESEEWKAILATKSSEDVVDILKETWEKRKSHVEDGSHFVGSSTPDSKKTGFKVSLKRVSNRLIGRKQEGRILRLRTADKNDVSQSNIDKRADLKLKLSGKTPKGKGVLDAGEEGIDKFLSASQSDALKTVIDRVEKFSGALQNVASLCQPVITPISSLIFRWHPTFLLPWVAFICFSRYQFPISQVHIDVHLGC
jgi:hypothetical protein